MSLPVAETRGGGEDVVLGEQEAAARGPVPACHRHRHQPGPGPITARTLPAALHQSQLTWPPVCRPPRAVWLLRAVGGPAAPCRVTELGCVTHDM